MTQPFRTYRHAAQMSHSRILHGASDRANNLIGRYRDKNLHRREPRHDRLFTQYRVEISAMSVTCAIRFERRCKAIEDPARVGSGGSANDDGPGRFNHVPIVAHLLKPARILWGEGRDSRAWDARNKAQPWRAGLIHDVGEKCLTAIWLHCRLAGPFVRRRSRTPLDRLPADSYILRS